MNFEVSEAVAVLSRTPRVLTSLLDGLDETWRYTREDDASWSPHEVVAHLVHGERTDWIPRLQKILDGDGVFEPFDREGHASEAEARSTAELLAEFTELRAQNLRRLAERLTSTEDLERAGTHPEFGPVTLKQMLATWTAHDLAHIAQITRVMARRYREDVGPWQAYLRILQA